MWLQINVLLKFCTGFQWFRINVSFLFEPKWIFQYITTLEQLCLLIISPDHERISKQSELFLRNIYETVQIHLSHENEISIPETRVLHNRIKATNGCKVTVLHINIYNFWQIPTCLCKLTHLYTTLFTLILEHLQTNWEFEIINTSCYIQHLGGCLQQITVDSTNCFFITYVQQLPKLIEHPLTTWESQLM